MVKSGLEIPEASSELLLPSAKNLPRKAELTKQVSSYLRKGSVYFKIKTVRPLSPSFFSQKCQFQDSGFQKIFQQQSGLWPHNFCTKFENSSHSGKFDFYYSPKLLYSRHFQSKWQLREHRVTITIKATFFAIRACPEVCSWSAQSGRRYKTHICESKSYPLLETQVRLEFGVLNFG